LTVYSRSGRLDPAVASPELLRAIPGAVSGEVEQFLAARAAEDAPAEALPAFTGIDAFISHGPMAAATVLAVASVDGAVFARRAVIVFTGLPLHPVRIVEWRQELGADAAP